MTPLGQADANVPYRDGFCRLWSLWDMLRFLAHDYCRASGIFGQFFAQIRSGVQPQPESFGLCFGEIKTLLTDLERLNLPVSLRQAQTIEKWVLSGGKGNDDLGRLVSELYGRMIDELAGQFLLMLPTGMAAHYSMPLQGWEAVLTAFPSIQNDVEEAEKCFALERSTACVFHLMRALEVPLKALSINLGIVKQSPTWEAYLSAMTAAIATKYAAKTRSDQEMRSYFSGLEGQLRAIKTAWRNPTMHDIARIYTSEMANELLVHVRGFMREAARELREASP